MRSSVIAAFILFLSGQLLAQEDSRLSVGNSLGVNIPVGTLNDDFRWGLSFSMNLIYEIDKVQLVGDFGWTNWFPQEKDCSPESDLTDAWNISAGIRYPVVGAFYMEGRAGYYFKNPGSFVMIPAVGLRFRRLDISIAYSVLSDSKFVAPRIGYFW